MQIMDIDSMLRKVHNKDKHNKKALFCEIHLY